MNATLDAYSILSGMIPIRLVLDSAEMNWKFPINFGRTQEQPGQSNLQEIPTHSWYPPSVVGTSRPSTPGSSSVTGGQQRPLDQPLSPSRGQPSPAEAAGVIARLKDKSIDELRKLLNDKEAYNSFFNSLEQVKIQNNFLSCEVLVPNVKLVEHIWDGTLRDELQKETLQIARENLEKEPRLLELKNQCTIIRTTELAAAQEKLADLQRQKEEMLRAYSPSSLLKMLSDGMNKLEEESELLHKQLLQKDIDLPTFVQKYKKLRTAFHRRALLHLAAKTSGF